MEYSAEEIDEIFLSDTKESNSITLSALKSYMQNLKVLKQPLQTQLSDLQYTKNKLDIDLFKLDRLSFELKDIQTMNNVHELEIKNREKLVDVLSDLLQMLEIDEKYFSYFETNNYDDIGVISRIEESLYRFDCILGNVKDKERINAHVLGDFNLTIANELVNRIVQTKKMFYKKFGHFFAKKLGSYKSTSRGELKIHKDIYDEVSRYRNILTYDLIEVYVKNMKKIYSREFRYHLESIFDILKRKENISLGANLSVIFQSLLLIRECEYDFIRKLCKARSSTVAGKADDASFAYFSDNLENFNIFSDVLIMIQTFLNDLYELGNFQTVIALGESIQCLQTKTKNELRSSFYERFLASLQNNYDIMKKNFVKLAVKRYKGESRTKTLSFFNDIVQKTTDDDLRNKIVHYQTKLILKHAKENRNSFRHMIRPFTYMYQIREHTDCYFQLVEEVKKTIIDEMFSSELDYTRIRKNIECMMDIDNEDVRNTMLGIFRDIASENTSESEYKKIERYF